MTVQFTAVFRPAPDGYVAYVEELPGANTQWATLDEARANFEEASESCRPKNVDGSAAPRD
jgi:predicted RNase H-like HicB family nuclease